MRKSDEQRADETAKRLAEACNRMLAVTGGLHPKEIVQFAKEIYGLGFCDGGYITESSIKDCIMEIKNAPNN